MAVRRQALRGYREFDNPQGHSLWLGQSQVRGQDLRDGSLLAWMNFMTLSCRYAQCWHVFTMNQTYVARTEIWGTCHASRACCDALRMNINMWQHTINLRVVSRIIPDCTEGAAGQAISVVRVHEQPMMSPAGQHARLHTSAEKDAKWTAMQAAAKRLLC